MESKIFDTFIIGHISKDEIIYEGLKTENIGGAVVYSSYAAGAGENKVGILTKVSQKDLSLMDTFNIDRDDIYLVISNETTSIRNVYLSADRERRICTALSIADQFVINEIPKIQSKIYHFAGLIAGDFDSSMIRDLSKRGKIALDVQGFLRNAEDGQMVFRDWIDKKEYLPYINFLKTDAAEAEIMTGYSSRKDAAKMLYELGAKEIMITHNAEVIIYDGKEFYTQPLKPRNLSGRTGRGDTCFSAYITERLHKGIKESLLYAAALVSLKMETPGPFKGDRKDVESYIDEFFR
jgi:sugar/nucleoside kinase (ribokinase family)